MRQSNGCSPFAQERLAPLSFGSGPFPHRQRLCDALTPGVLMTTAPLSFNCNIRLTLSYCKAMFMSISENPQCLAGERAGFEKTAKNRGKKAGERIRGPFSRMDMIERDEGSVSPVWCLPGRTVRGGRGSRPASRRGPAADGRRPPPSRRWAGRWWSSCSAPWRNP